MAEPQSTSPAPQTVSPAGLWFGVLAGPVAWVVHATGSYLLAPIACRLETAAPLYALTVVTMLVAAAAGVYSWRNSQRVRAGVVGSTGRRRGRTGFMAMAGVFMSIMFLAIILIQSIPMFFLDVC